MRRLLPGARNPMPGGVSRGACARDARFTGAAFAQRAGTSLFRLSAAARVKYVGMSLGMPKRSLFRGFPHPPGEMWWRTLCGNPARVQGDRPPIPLWRRGPRQARKLLFGRGRPPERPGGRPKMTRLLVRFATDDDAQDLAEYGIALAVIAVLAAAAAIVIAGDIGTLWSQAQSVIQSATSSVQS